MTEKTPLLQPAEVCLLVARDDAQGYLVVVVGQAGGVQVASLALLYRRAGQQVTAAQLVPVQATDGLPHHGRAAAEAGRHGEPVGHAQVGATAALGKSQADLVSGTDPVHGPQRLFPVVDVQRHGGAGYADEGIDPGAQPRTAETHFHRGGVGRVVQQPVAPGEGLGVQGAAIGEADAMGAESPAILQQAENAGLDDFQAHSSSPPSAR